MLLRISCTILTIRSSLFFLVCSNAPIVIYFGPQQSSLGIALVSYLSVEDITLILFSTEEHLWQWLNSKSSLQIASLILQPVIHTQAVISRCHIHINVRSILCLCSTDDLTTLQRFSRSYPKVDGIFDDDNRLLIKLVVDLIHFSEELGDQRRRDQSNEIEAQRNYSRALKLCDLAKKI